MSKWLKTYAWKPNPDTFSDFALSEFDFKVARAIFCDGFESFSKLSQSIEYRFEMRVDARALNEAIARLRHHRYLVDQELSDAGQDLAIDYRLSQLNQMD